MSAPGEEGWSDPLAPDPLVKAIAAHRKVNPAAYQGIGLTEAEEDAMRAALAAAGASQVQLTGEQATPTTYTVNLDADPHEWVTVVLTCLAGAGPHKPPHDTWAVRKLSYCLNDEGDWEFEPIPSSRDDEFFARTRWDLESALSRAVTVAKCEAAQRHAPVQRPAGQEEGGDD